MKFQFLNVKDLSPQGWLKKQLELQASGLHGNLDKIWPDVKESKWIGGDKEGWERLPYFLDGFIPLAYLLNDKKAIKVADFYVKNILERQQADGWIAPGDVEVINKDLYKASEKSMFYASVANPTSKDAVDALISCGLELPIIGGTEHFEDNKTLEIIMKIHFL